MHKGIGQESNRQAKEQKKETNPSLLEGCLGRPKGMRNKGYFAHEYVIFYRRGNYLIEGETSPINRSHIPHFSFMQSFRD